MVNLFQVLVSFLVLQFNDVLTFCAALGDDISRRTEEIWSKDLVPGDIIIIPPSGIHMSFDAVVMSGLFLVVHTNILYAIRIFYHKCSQRKLFTVCLHLFMLVRKCLKCAGKNRSLVTYLLQRNLDRSFHL